MQTRTNERRANLSGPIGARRIAGTIARWVVPLFWAAVVLTLGSSLFSYARTSATFDPILSRIMPGLGPDASYSVQVFIRRSAHYLEYAILFLFLNLGPLRGRPIVAFAVCVGCASLDESLQLLTPSRSGTLFDVALDTSGATTILAVAMPYWDRMRYHRQIVPKQ